MKNKGLKYYIASAYLCSTIMLFAQPGTDAAGGGLETPDTPAAPVDTYLVFLALVGVMFVYMKIKTSLKNNIQN